MSKAIAETPSFKSDLTTTLTSNLNLPKDSLVISKITFVSGRRQLLADSVDVDYTITLTNIAAVTIMTSVSALVSSGTLTSSLVDLGYTGASASVKPLFIDRSPTSAPTVIPLNFVTKSKSCFAGSETVSMESGVTKSISDVRVGDRVLAATSMGETLYSEVGPHHVLLSRLRGRFMTLMIQI